VVIVSSSLPVLEMTETSPSCALSLKSKWATYSVPAESHASADGPAPIRMMVS
jgi:hypothetical protein